MYYLGLLLGQRSRPAAGKIVDAAKWVTGLLDSPSFLHIASLCLLLSGNTPCIEALLSGDTLIPVIYTLKRTEVLVRSLPSRFAFGAQCSLPRKASIICLKDFIERGQGKDSLMFCPLDFPVCFLNGKLVHLTIPKTSGT